jgi:hypothetical protein
MIRYEANPLHQPAQHKKAEAATNYQQDEPFK